MGASTIRIGFLGPLYYKYNKEPPNIVLVIIWAPHITHDHLSPIGARDEKLHET